MSREGNGKADYPAKNTIFEWGFTPGNNVPPRKHKNELAQSCAKEISSLHPLGLRKMLTSSSSFGSTTPFGRKKTQNVQKTGTGSTSSLTSASVRKTIGWTPHRDGVENMQPSTIIAVSEGRGQARGEIGMAAIDLHRPMLVLSQYSDMYTYSTTLARLVLLNPMEMITARTVVGNEATGLVRAIRESMPEVVLTAVQRQYFSDQRGMAVIKHLAAPHCAYVEHQVASKYYCLAAAAALMKYIEYSHHVKYAAGSLHIDLHTLENSVIIDFGSIRKLELVSSTHGRWEESLFGALHHTRTRGGTRLLRAMLLQPPANKNIIEARLDALQYIASHQELFHTLQSILGRFPDLDWLLAVSIQMPKEETEHRCELHLSHVIALKNALELVSPLVNALSTAENTILSSFHKEMNSPSLKALLEMLRGVLHEDARLTKGTASMRNQCCFAIKPHINDLLDIARKIYSEIVDDITVYVDELCKEYNLELQVGYNTSLGFHIVVPVGKKLEFPQLPSVFIQKQHSRRRITCTTELLYQLDQRSRETMKEILLMSNIIVMEVMQEIRQCLGVLCALSEAVSSLDMIVALAHASSLRNWVRPELGNTIAIRNGRHPILDQLSSIPLVANNTFISEEHRVLVITGPNMSGKSTYLRQVALLHILAQIGCFIPADYGCIRIVNQIFTHLGSEDSPENNTSTFQAQMIDISYMLTCVGPEALVVLDEIGSATSIEEGGAIAWAILEYLLQAHPIVIIATHIIFLTNLSKLYPQVVNYCMDSENQGTHGRLHLTHIVRHGVTKAQHYGLALAKVTALPQRILTKASDLIQTLPSTQVEVMMDKTQRKEQTAYYLASELISLATTLFPSSSSNLISSTLQLSAHEPEPVSYDQLKNPSPLTISGVLASSSTSSSLNRVITNNENNSGMKRSKEILSADVTNISGPNTDAIYVKTTDALKNYEKEKREMDNQEGFRKEVEHEDGTIAWVKQHLQALVKTFLKHSDKKL